MVFQAMSSGSTGVDYSACGLLPPEVVLERKALSLLLPGPPNPGNPNGRQIYNLSSHQDKEKPAKKTVKSHLKEQTAKRHQRSTSTNVPVKFVLEGMVYELDL